jgi:hypothetical protein
MHLTLQLAQSYTSVSTTYKASGMKGKHRHELETNELARRLAAGIEKSRPYGPTILGVLVAIVVCLMILSYLSSASATQQAEAWSQYFTAMQTPNVNFEQSLQMLKLSAEEHPGTPMQQWADITWADGQLWLASAAFLQNRDAATAALSRAADTYNSLLKTATEERIADRANFGLGRVYEMQDDLPRAKEHYALVGGGFAELAKARVEQIEGKSTGEQLTQTMSWLSTAELPKRAAPIGPGTPGRQPLFSPGELQMPTAGMSGRETNGAAPGGSGADSTGSEASLDELINHFKEASKSDDTDRYDTSKSLPSDDSSTDESDPGASPTSEP